MKYSTIAILAFCAALVLSGCEWEPNPPVDPDQSSSTSSGWNQG